MGANTPARNRSADAALNGASAMAGEVDVRASCGSRGRGLRKRVLDSASAPEMMLDVGEGIGPPTSGSSRTSAPHAGQVKRGELFDEWSERTDGAAHGVELLP